MLQDKGTVAGKGYASTLFTFSKKRKIVWGEICNYLNQHFIPKDSAVLELGSGYGDFIGQIRPGKRWP